MVFGSWHPSKFGKQPLPAWQEVIFSTVWNFIFQFQTCSTPAVEFQHSHFQIKRVSGILLWLVDVLTKVLTESRITWHQLGPHCSLLLQGQIKQASSLSLLCLFVSLTNVQREPCGIGNDTIKFLKRETWRILKWDSARDFLTCIPITCAMVPQNYIWNSEVVLAFNHIQFNHIARFG